MTRQTWREHAACTNTGIDFFPETTGRSHHRNAALQLCRQQCPVQAQCLEHALTTPERHGIWGGHTADDRHTIRTTRRR